MRIGKDHLFKVAVAPITFLSAETQRQAGEWEGFLGVQRGELRCAPIGGWRPGQAGGGLLAAGHPTG